MPKSNWCVTVAFAGLVAAGAPLGVARDPGAKHPIAPTQKQQPPVRVEVEVVQVPLSVLDPWGRIVTGLRRENFRLFEDGVEQEIVKVQVEEVPISVGIVFDKSGSMGIGGAIQAARLMGVQFFKTGNYQDEFMVVAFDSRAQLVSPFTENVEKLKMDLMYTRAGGMTAMNDAIYLGLHQMKNGKHSRKALIVISDGMENRSRYSEKDVEQAAIEADTQVYSIGAGWGLLRSLTEKTGGRTFGYANYENTVQHIWNELRNQYVLGYASSNRARDGKWRKIKVQLRVPRGMPPLKVYAKSGYLAPAN